MPKRNEKLNVFKIVRMCLGLTVTEMSQRTGASVDYLKSLETGRQANPSDKFIETFTAGVGNGLKPETVKFLFAQQTGKSKEYQRYLLEALNLYAIEHQKNNTK